MSVVSAFAFLSISHNTDIWSISVEFYSASVVNIFWSAKMSIIAESVFFILVASLLLFCSWRRKEKVYQKNFRLKWKSWNKLEQP